MSLQAVSQALAQHLGETIAPAASGRQEKLDRWGKTIGATGLAILVLVFVAIFISILASKLFGLNIDFFFNSVLPVIASIALPMLFIGAGLVISPRLIKELFGVPSSKRSMVAIQGAPTAALPVMVDAEQRPSITEHTTEHLEMRNERAEASHDTHSGPISEPDP